MKALLLLVAVAIMSSGVRGISYSKSCSTVNGKTICNDEQSDGNVAGASSQAGFGGGQTYQRTFAGTGNTGTGDYQSSSQQIGQPPQVYQQPPQVYQQPPQVYQQPQGDVYSSSSSSSSSYGSDPQILPFGPFNPFPAGGAFAGAGGAFAGAFAGAGGFGVPGVGAFAGPGFAGFPLYGRR